MVFACTNEDIFNMEFEPDYDNPCCVCGGPSARQIYGTFVCEPCYEIHESKSTEAEQSFDLEAFEAVEGRSV